ncbi:MAG: JAB domain-containing protein [Candidatus Caldatribacteriota bacterium]|nr:JAB domain-containing protein [Candidatus Caldatribacteriota bacterium]
MQTRYHSSSTLSTYKLMYVPKAAGPAESSLEDMELTISLVNACKAVDIPVLDHVIVGNDGFLSMRREQPEIFAV